MNLAHALLCIDCDEVFVAAEIPCNPRCPNCGSSVFMPLSRWVQTWTAYDRSDEEEAAGHYGTSTGKRRIEIVRTTPIAA